MKKICTLAMVLLGMSALAQGSPVTLPYESDMASDGAGWTVVNVVDTTATFTVGGKSDFNGSAYPGFSNYETGYIYNLVKNPDGTFDNNVDDWIISPAIPLKGGVTYKISYRVKPVTSCDPASEWSFENYKLLVANNNTVDALSAGTCLYDYNKTTNPNWGSGFGGGRSFVTVNVTFTPTTDGNYYFGYHLYALKYTYAASVLNITGFKIADLISAVTPNQVQDFYSYRDTVAPDRQLRHTFQYRLDSLDADRLQFPPEVKYQALKIYRNDVLIDSILNPEITKTTVFYTDDESKGLTPGMHTYKAIAQLTNGRESAPATFTMNQWVGPVPVDTVPWTAKISDANFSPKKEWISANGPDKNATGSWSKSGTGTSAYLKYTPKSNKPDDAYLILPPLFFSKPGLYNLTSNIKRGHASQDGLQMFVVKGTPTTYKGFEGKEKTDTIPFINDANAHDYYCGFNITEPGTYSIAIRRVSTKATSTSYLQINKLSVQGMDLAPAPIADLKGEIVGDNARLTWTNPTLNNVHSQLSEITKIDVLRYNNIGDTVVAATLTAAKDLVPGAKIEFTDSIIEKPFIYNYKVVPYLSDKTHLQAAMSAFADYEWVGTKIQKLPFEIVLDGGAGHGHQEYVIPMQKLWAFEHDASAQNSDFSIYTSYISLSCSRNRTYASRLIAPPMDLKKGYYQVRVYTKGGWADMPLKFSYRDADDITKTLKNKTDFSTATYSSSYRYLNDVVIKVDEAGVKNFVISMEGASPSSGTCTSLNIQKIHFTYVPIVPNAATALSATADAEGALKATVAWTNPTASSMAGEMPAFTKAVIYRNGELAGTVTEGLEPGASCTWVDENVPDAGIYTYKVEIYSEDGCSADAPEARSNWIGTGKKVPYTASDYSEWNTAAGVWTVNDDNVYYENEDETTDDWGYSAPVILTAGKYYMVSFSTWAKEAYMGDEALPNVFGLHYGLVQSAEAMTAALGSYTQTASSEETAVALKYYIKAVEAAPEAKVAAKDEAVTDATNEATPLEVAAGNGVIGFNFKVGGSTYIKDFKVDYYIPSAVGNITDGNGLVVRGDNLLLPAECDVTVTDLSGKTVLAARNASTVNITSLAKGIYVVVAEYDGHNLVCKIIK